jgi:hypothetical protein
VLGCNAVLGIDAPRGEELSPVEEPSTTLDGGGSDGPLRTEGDEPVVSEAEPSPYAWATWPMPNPASLSRVVNPQTFGVRSPGVVLDSLTKLEWQQTVDGKLRERDEAESYCENLSLGGGGFRLPSRIELLSIVDFTQANPSLDTKAFPSAQAGKYWTSSRYAGDAESGWLINFEFGTGLVFIEPGDKPHLARCVR